MQHDGRGSILIHCNFTYHHAKYSQFAAEVADFWTQLFHLQRLRRKCTQRSSQSTLGWAEPHEELHFRKHKDSSSTDRDEEERSLSHKHLSFWLLVLVWQIRADTNEAAPVGGGGSPSEVWEWAFSSSKDPQICVTEEQDHGCDNMQWPPPAREWLMVIWRLSEEMHANAHARCTGMSY